jgi:queuine tRNA-ribosyltransferase
MFTLETKLKSGIRVGELTTPHGVINTPFFMPVGTVGSVKSVSPEELEKLGAEIILSNTYHLYLRPGEKLIKELGGLHNFMRWDKPILTDSGGYQVFSLAKNNSHLSFFNDQLNKKYSNDQINGKCEMVNGKFKSLVKVTDDGVEFTSHLDGSKHFFTPEKVIDIQLDLGVDILMPLDVCPSGKATRAEVEKAVETTTKWAKRAKVHFESRISNLESGKRPMLHGIVQGGLYEDLRRKSAKELIELDFDGYSIGGLAVDLETREMWNIVKLMGEILPENKQRYLMGVGTPDDIIKAVKLGVDMFDCVLPTRLARHGSIFVKNDKSVISTHSEPTAGWIEEGEKSYYRLVNLLNSQFRTDSSVIDLDCKCPACAGGFSKAYISHLLRSNEILGLRLATLHNLWQYLELMRSFKRLD